MTRAVFAIPGDKDQRTGGSIYDATVLRYLNDSGCQTEHLQLPASFPNPTARDMEATLDALRSVQKSQAIIVDGLAFGAMPPAALSDVEAPLIALVHHPLGLETGLDPTRVDQLLLNEKAALEQATHVITTSHHTGDIVVEHLGVDRDRLTVALPGFERPERKGRKANPPTILSVGLLAKRKGHDVLLEALALLKDLDWNAEIIGRVHDPDVATALHRQAETSSLTERVRFVGEVGPADLQEAYQRASIFALATRYEGYGMVLSEAMLHGLPVVSCTVGAVPETVGDAGILVPPEDPEALATALRALLQDPKEADHYSRLALEKAQDLPRWTDTTRCFIDVIDKVTP